MEIRLTETEQDYLISLVSDELKDTIKGGSEEYFLITLLTKLGFKTTY